MKPGETIVPGSSEPPTKTEDKAAPIPEKPVDSPAAAPAAQAETPQAAPTPTWETSVSQTDLPPASSAQPVSWTASEYVAHHKAASWFLLLFGGVVVSAGLIFIATQEIFPPLAIAIGGLLFGVFAARKPRVLQYTVDSHGLEIGTKRYPYQIFRSFSVMEEGTIRSILLMPIQRFDLPITVYYAPEDEDAILGVLGSFLPHEERAVSFIDRFMSQIRF